MTRAERLTALSGRIAALPNVPFNGRECVLAQFVGALKVLLAPDAASSGDIIGALERAVESEERRKR